MLMIICSSANDARGNELYLNLEQVEEGDKCYDNSGEAVSGQWISFIQFGEGYIGKPDCCPPSRIDFDKAEQIYRMGLTNLSPDYQMIFAGIESIRERASKS